MTSQTKDTTADQQATPKMPKASRVIGFCLQYGIKVYAPGGDYRPIADLYADCLAHEQSLKPVRHVPKPKDEARIYLRQNATDTTNTRKAIGDGWIYKSVEVRCSNGVTVSVFADGTVKTAVNI